VLSLIETGRLVGTRGAYELTTRMDTLDVPATVQALLAARIDRLGEREKQALYTAAVIGKEFARPLLEAVVQMATAEVDAGLSALRDAEMIIERAIYPVAEYSFKHPLTHNVALHAQLAHTRRGCHAKVAEVLTETTRDRHDEYAALIAHHWSEAGEAQRAATWQVRAARWVSVTDFGASRRHWQEARRLLLASPDSSDRSRLLLEVYPELLNCSDLLGTEAADAASVFAEASALARDAGDLRTEALLEAVYSNVISAQSDFDNMIRHTTRAVTVADASGDRALRIFARYFLGRALVWLGRWHEGIAVYDEAAAIGESDAAAAIEVLRYRPYIECLAIRANALAVTGRPHDAFDFVERFDTLRRIAGAGADLSSAAADRFWPCLILANANRALQCADEALQIAERYGGERGLVYALLAGGGSRVLAGRWAEGNALLERAQQRIAATGAGAEWSTPIDAFQALCLAHLGERERSLELLRRAEQRPDTALRFTVGFVRARAMRVAGGLDLEAGIHAEIALALHNAEQRRSSSLEPLLLLERAGLARLRGDAVGMANDLAAALRLITAFGMTGWESYARSIAA
jgi:tetratricopeptide (TPR) repeat protein